MSQKLFYTPLEETKRFTVRLKIEIELVSVKFRFSQLDFDFGSVSAWFDSLYNKHRRLNVLHYITDLRIVMFITLWGLPHKLSRLFFHIGIDFDFRHELHDLLIVCLLFYSRIIIRIWLLNHLSFYPFSNKFSCWGMINIFDENI